jgi:magnesium transporter
VRTGHNAFMIVDCAVYKDGKRRPGELPFDEAFEAGREPDSFVWIGLYEPSREEFDAVAREFNLHELAVEDAILAHQRPKLEVYGESLFVVLKTARYLDELEALEFGEIMLFIGDGFVVTVRHKPASALGGVRQQMERRPDLLRYGPGAVLHAIVDRVVDDYFPVLSGLDDDIKEAEREVFSEEAGAVSQAHKRRHRDRGQPVTNPAERIYKLKREVIELHQCTAPLVEPLDRLVRRRLPEIHPDLAEYFRDVEDHLLRVVDEVGGFRDLLTSVLDANLAQIGVRQNEDMRKISAWVAIAAVPTMLAGIYGMNFLHMPELRWVGGYPLALALMAGACLVLWRAFRRNDWL